MTSTRESPLDRETQIELLREDNFSTWFIDIRAKLRSKKLWKYTQSAYIADNTTTTTTTTIITEEGESSSAPPPPVTKKEQKAIQDWEDKSLEAADIMTPTISRAVKRRLTEAEFDDGYLMLSRLQTLLQPSGSSEFMRLSKEYYSLQFKSFKTISDYLTYIKVLEERIDATKVTLDTNNRTILCLSMSLPQEYQYLVQIWAVTPSITAEKARTMVLEASRQHSQAIQNTRDPESAYQVRQQGSGLRKCDHCGSTKHPSDRCWTKYPQLAPEWFQMKLNYDLAKKDQAKVATNGREDDFTDINGTGTHFSC